jgi:hypothetical protein
MKNTRLVPRVKVSADGRGVVSHAGVGLLREMAQATGLVGAVNGALIDTYRGLPVHAPGQVFADLAVAIADGADAVSGIAVLRDRQELFGPVASMPTAWRLLDRIGEDHLPAVRAARGVGRARTWAGGGGPDLDKELHLDFDATITIAHSEKEDAAPTFKKTFGFHPLLCFLDRAEVGGGEALAGLLRAGNAGSNTAADHIEVLKMALASLPAHARPRKGEPDSPRLLARSDSAGATHGFADECRELGVGFSFGFPVSTRVQGVVNQIPDTDWYPAIDTDGGIRDGAWEAKATGLRNLPCKDFAENSAWLEAIHTAIDLYCWTKLIAFAHLPSLAKIEVATFRYRILHTAARLVHSGRQLHLRIDGTWKWAREIAAGYDRIRQAFS